MLAGLGDVDRLTGLDRSPAMLERARAKVPHARFVQGDMTTFELGERFDAVICVFDTLNHLARFEHWRALFARAAAHLHDGGLFAFDVNTVGQLERLAAAGAVGTRRSPRAPTVVEQVHRAQGRASSGTCGSATRRARSPVTSASTSWASSSP